MIIFISGSVLKMMSKIPSAKARYDAVEAQLTVHIYTQRLLFLYINL